MRNDYVYMVSGDGHRHEYAELIKELFGFNAILSVPSFKLFIKLLFARKLVIGTIDDCILFSTFLTCGRALLRRPTVGLFLRPSSCYSRSFRSALKKLIVMHSNSKYGKIVTILRHINKDKFTNIAKDSVVDPQMWDIITTNTNLVLDANIDNYISLIKSGRKLLSSIGRISDEKGIDYIYNLVNLHPEVLNHVAIVVAGIYGDYSKDKIDEMQSLGVEFINRRLSENEIYTLYQRTDYVWCCYTENYDQSSGVFGRALQFGVPVIVRLGSELANYRSNKISSVYAINPLKVDELKSVVLSERKILPSANPTFKDMAFVYRDEFVNKINSLLDVK